MWDLLVLTAGSERQKRNFELLLAEVNTSIYCRETLVISDYPEDVKIGSGGATLNVLRSIEEHFRGQKVLLIHSGGLSQRLPHVSAFGKIFLTLPNGITVLEAKLRTYQFLSTMLSPGLLVAASDVLEDVSAFEKNEPASDMILFATESNLEVITEATPLPDSERKGEMFEKVASGHGVFVMENGCLKSVLQKPSLEEMRAAGAILPSGNALTDCFFWISWRVCEQLVSLSRSRGPCSVETCCYGDFMRPLGSEPLLDYLTQGSAEISSWRRAFADIFSKISPETINLGVDAFFHLGTPQELLEHCREGSIFSKKFLEKSTNTIHCSLTNCQIGSETLLEYSKFDGAIVGNSCIVSGCESNDTFKLDDYSILFSLCIGNQRYITVLLHMDDDVKAKKSSLRWMGKETGLTDVSLWNAKIFPVESTRERSLKATLELAKGNEWNGERISMAEALMASDVQEMVAFRRCLKAATLTHQSPSSVSP